MKKHIAALCAVLIFVLAFIPGAAAAGPSLTTTEAYCIIDADTGLVLAQQNMDEELHPASITKVMTLGLACEKAQGDWEDTKLTVSHEDVYSLAGTDSSRHYIPSLLGSKIGHTNIARYSYACLAEQDGVRLICVTMQSQLKTDKYNDVRTLLDYAFSTYKNYTDLPSQGVSEELTVVSGGKPLGTVTVTDPGIRLLLADGLTASDVSVTLELPEQYVLGVQPDVYAVYTVNGGKKQESASVRVKAEIDGLEDLLTKNANATVSTPEDADLKHSAWWKLLLISLGGTVIAAVVTYGVVRFLDKRKRKRKKRRQASKRLR